MIFELAQDFRDTVASMPREHPRHRMLELLEEAIRRDIHFIDRHPTTLFQCMWNTHELSNRSLSDYDELLLKWHDGKQEETPGFRWLRLEMTTQTSRGHQRLVPFGSRPVDASISENGDLVAVCSEKEVRVVDESMGTQFSIQADAGAKLSAVALSADGRHLCATQWTEMNGSRCRIVSTNEQRQPLEFRIDGIEILSVTFSGNGDALAVCGVGKTAGWIGFYDLTEGKLVWRKSTPGRLLGKVEFTRDDECVIAAGGDGFFLIRSAKSGKPLNDKRCHAQGVSDISVSPSGHLIMTVGKDGKVGVWSMKGKKRRLHLKFAFESSPNNPLLSGCFLHDDSVALADYQGNVYQRTLSQSSKSVKILGCGKGSTRLLPADNGEILMVAASGTQLCHVVDVAGALAAGGNVFARALAIDYTHGGQKATVTLSSGGMRSFDIFAHNSNTPSLEFFELPGRSVVASCVSSSRFHLLVAHDGQWQLGDTDVGTGVSGSFSIRLEDGSLFSLSPEGKIVCAFSRERLEVVSVDTNDRKIFRVPILPCSIRMLQDGSVLAVGRGCRLKSAWEDSVSAVWTDSCTGQHKFATPFGDNLHSDTLSVLLSDSKSFLSSREAPDGNTTISLWNLLTLGKIAERSFSKPVKLLEMCADSALAAVYVPGDSACHIADMGGAGLDSPWVLHVSEFLDVASIRSTGDVLVICDQCGNVFVFRINGIPSRSKNKEDVNDCTTEER